MGWTNEMNEWTMW